jgi:hypothetical protein
MYELVALATSRIGSWCVTTLCALAVLFHTTVCWADATLPNGYQHERIGATDWTYPSAAQKEAHALVAVLAKALSATDAAFGVTTDPAFDIRIAVNPEDMQTLAPRGARLPDYASGIALSEEGVILLTLTAPFTWNRPNMEQVLVHEVAHVALGRAIGNNQVPRWFNEGVAIQVADERSMARLRVLWDAAWRGNLVPLARLSSSFGGHFGAVDLAYAQSADVVRYMRDEDTYGTSFTRLITQLRAGKPFEDAVLVAYNMPLSALERAWRADAKQRFGRWPVALMGLSAVWMLAALLLIAGYVRVRHTHRKTLQKWAIEENAVAVAAAATTKATQQADATPTPVHPLEAFFDEREKRLPQDAGVPTVTHDGRNHTLH